MADGTHWEWRGFGHAEEGFRREFERLPLKYSTPWEETTDEYVWFPGGSINVKLRSGGSQEGLKLKRFLETSGDLELWLEDPAERGLAVRIRLDREDRGATVPEAHSDVSAVIRDRERTDLGAAARQRERRHERFRLRPRRERDLPEHDPAGRVSRHEEPGLRDERERPDARVGVGVVGLDRRRPSGRGRLPDGDGVAPDARDPRDLGMEHREGRPVGILSVKDIVHYIVALFPNEVLTLPPDPARAEVWVGRDGG